MAPEGNLRPSGSAAEPAFVEALQLELEAYGDSLEFHPEYPLTSEPLKIDCVVIKKAKDLVIEKNIAAMFRNINLLEYKSPGDYVSVDDFYKVYGYVCLYASFERVPITDMTITFVESRHPKKLLEHLKNVRGYTVEKVNPGIYTVSGDILPIQVIDSRGLSPDENLWLKGLSKQLDPLTVVQIVEEAKRKGKNARIQAYINVIAMANLEAMEEAIKVNGKAKSLDEVFIRTGLVARWEELKALDIAKNMLNLGIPIETIISATKLDPEKVKELYQGADN